MAKKAEVRIEGKETVSKASKSARTGLGDLDKTVKKSSASMLKAGAAIGAAVVAFRTLNRVMNDLQEAYYKQEQAETMFQAALRATGTEAEVSAKNIFKFASELQQITIYGDEAILSATSLLQSLAKLNEDGLKKIMPLMLDFSTGMKVDLNAAMSLVGKTLGSTTNALSRYGIVIDMTLSKEEKLAQLIEELQNKFGGMAEAIGDTAYGATVKLDNVIGDLKEQMGRTVAFGMKPFRESLTAIVIEIIKVKKETNDALEYLSKLGQEQVTAAESLIYWNTQLSTSESALGKLWSRMWRGRKIQSEEYIKAKIAEYEILVKVEEGAAKYDKKRTEEATKEAAAIKLLFDIKSEALRRFEELRLEALSPLEKELELIRDELDLYSDLKKEFEKYSQGWIAVENVILSLLGKEKKLLTEIAEGQLSLIDKLAIAYGRTEEGIREALEAEVDFWRVQILNVELTEEELYQVSLVIEALEDRLKVEEKITEEINKRPSLLPQAGTPPIAGATGGGGQMLLGPWPTPMREEEEEEVSAGMFAFNEALSAGAPQIAGFIGMIGSFSTTLSMATGPAALLVIAVMAVIQIFQGIMQVLQPLVDSILQPLIGILIIIGRVLGSILAPVFGALAVIVDKLAQGFVWLYNKVIMPIANGFIKVFNFLSNALITFANLFLRKSKHIAKRDISAGTLQEISLGDVYAAGETGMGGTTANLGSTTTIQRQPDNYFHIYFQGPILGVSGIDEAAELIIAAIERHGDLGGKIHIEEAIVPMAG